MAKQASSSAKGGASARQSKGQSNSRSRDSQAQLRASLSSHGGDAPSEATAEYDETYNLVSVLYHALKGAQTYNRYINDAERAGDSDLSQFFEDIRDEEIDRAQRAKRLLFDRLVDEEDLEDSDDEEE